MTMARILIRRVLRLRCRVLFSTLLGMLVLSAGVQVCVAEESAKEKEQLRQAIGIPKKIEITVEQDKVYHRKGRFELALFGGAIPNDPLVRFLTEGVYLSYFLSEIWGIEAMVGINQMFETQLLKDLESGAYQGKVVNVGVSRTQQFYDGGIVFHPMYGKFSLFAQRTIHYDTFLAAGVGTTVTSSKTLNESAGNYWKSDHYRLNTYIGLGQRMYVNSFFAIRIDIRDIIIIDQVQEYPDRPNGKDIQHNVLVALGVSVLFPFKGD